FSADGQELLVSNLVGGSLVLGWKLTRPRPLDSGGRPGPVFLRAAKGGRRFTLFRYTPTRYSYEIRDVEAGLIRSAAGEGVLNIGLSGDGRLLAESRAERIDVLATDTGQRVSTLECRQCFMVEITEDGKRVVAKSREVLAMMSIDPPRLLWSETERRGRLGQSIATSGDGGVIAWVYQGHALVRVEGRPTLLDFASAPRVVGVSAQHRGTGPGPPAPAD